MRRASPKMLRSGHSLHRVERSDALPLAGAVRTHARKRSGAALRAAVSPARLAFNPERGDGTLASRLRLLEGFISRTDVADCARYALQWLAEEVGISQSI